jgi:hypothetical protein
MTIVGFTSGHQEIIGYINTSYTSLGTFGGSRRLSVYSSIASDIGTYAITGNPWIVDWATIFAFNTMPGDKTTKLRPLPTAQLGQVSTARFGQATDDFYLNYQCYKSPTYAFTYGIGSATYPRGRYNLTNIGTVQTIESISGINIALGLRSADEMYIYSPYADFGALTLDLQIQYCAKLTYSVAGTFYTLDI